ncbi:MAG: NAD(P)H-binding protein [Pedobacter sp.]|uniref:NmrA family NAD(P)-binding protein n=1 Tax=Pedobacter sp. TaxID=1411316 RepID=UPI00280A16F7|nr:NAD(P)H-binding protein [Pedobacter sp.]MDQ8005804.1 NAD(P)H-binding protein [Pedobacter sp.]
MKIIISGSLGNIGQHLTTLLAKENELVVISSNADRKAAIEALGATAAIGSINDVDFLSQTFAGADALFAMTPPNMGGQNIIENTVNAGKVFAKAIENANVPRIVMLSSIGADVEKGTGPIAGLHQIEKIYNELNASVTFLRAGYFYTNHYNDVPLIKNAGIIGANFPAETKIPYVHPHDIAVAAAEELQKQTTGKNVRYIVSDFRSAADTASLLGSATGNPTLPWVEFTDEQSLQGMIGAGLPEEMAHLYTEMGQGLREGKIQTDFVNNNHQAEGITKLEDFAQEFKSKF